MWTRLFLLATLFICLFQLLPWVILIGLAVWGFGNRYTVLSNLVKWVHCGEFLTDEENPKEFYQRILNYPIFQCSDNQTKDSELSSEPVKKEAVVLVKNNRERKNVESLKEERPSQVCKEKEIRKRSIATEPKRIKDDKRALDGSISYDQWRKQK